MQAQIFDDPSEYGIASGRISRLAVYTDQSKRTELLFYERGWHSPGIPKDPVLRGIVEQMVDVYDGSQVNWSFEQDKKRLS
ncbi:hypothetical protein D3C74_462150 [compost metagenome]